MCSGWRGTRAGLALLLAAGMAACDDNTQVSAAFNRIWGSSEAALVDGDAATARFSNPVNVAVAADGTVYVADFDNDALRAISPTGLVSTVVKQANFSRPFGLTLSADGATLYVQTDANDTGQRNGTTGTIWALNRATGGIAVVARNLGRPRGILALADGRIVMADLVRNVISTLDPGTGTVVPVAGQDGVAGFANGHGTAASFARPYGMALMPDGSILVADQTNNAIRQLTLAGDVTTFAGSGALGLQNGPVATATFNGPQDVAVSGGNVYVADTENHVIRLIAGGSVSTEAGDGVAGFVDATGTAAEFFGLEGIALTADGTVLWMADGNGGNGDPFNRVRRLMVP
ncbi:MAG: hypothetical protein ISP90_15980 [Nevskia sp.]|nr:hypothetical protein [Nevskia sp.]